ncbi:hypothetical protein [Cerasicoccus fimbriatus]|uniref:hypothetical protein n=1 Tax=Cerasicoccus fimbriatus TaxID=3014554 RepID=UPI0022B3919A|nr:hypothetical protein [Cerasicoccus sp. TK19100]
MFTRSLLCVSLICSSAAVAQNTYVETFEDPSFDASVSNPSWNNYGGTITRQTGTVNGVSASSGTAFGLVLDPANDGGVFSRLGGSQTDFMDGFTVSQDFYVDMSDPLINSGNFGDYSYDLTTATNDTSEAYQRDFFFNVASSGTGEVWVTTTNQTFFGPSPVDRFDDRAVINSSGWYTMEWQFTSNGSNAALNSIIRNSAGNSIWASQEVSPFPIATTGGHRYLWNTFEDTTNGLALDSSFSEGVDIITLTPSTVEIVDGGNEIGNQLFLIDGAQTSDAVSVENVMGGQTTLKLNPGAVVTSDVTVNANGILAGTGGIIGSVAIHVDAIHAPGSSPGVQTITGSYDNDGSLEIEVAGPNGATGTFANPVSGDYDQLFIDGDVEITGDIIAMQFGGYDFSINDRLAIVLATGEITFTGNADLSSLTGLANAQIILGTEEFDGQTYNALLIIPEPRDYALLASLGVLGVVFVARRRK